ncbi:MAG: C40 family peptidase [Firmicutes bacterium]|nr:C40 family peptidase [Bacillota bacterium]
MKSVLMKGVYIGLFVLCTLLFPTTVNAATRGVVTGEVVNVRAYSEINDTNRLFQVRRGHTVEILGVCGEFFRANINDSENVYISRDWVKISETQGTVNNSLYVYNLPVEKGGERISHIYAETIVTVISVFENWFGIFYDGELVFVDKSYVDIPYFVELQTAHVRYTSSSTLGEDIVAFAKQYLGSPYLFGGTTPRGFDCSGFMQYVLRNFDITVNRVSRDQARNGTHVDRNALQPADLVFFSASPGGGNITHVGMYIGGGQMIHASTWNTGVRLSDINSTYNRPRFVTARRVI